MTRPSLPALVAVLALGAAVPAAAATWTVEFSSTSGANWTGVVDSDTDTLTILTWTEAAGGYDYWTPQATALPLVFSAVYTDLSAYDVAEDWDGTIDTSWGFLSDLTKPEIAWNEGVFSGNNSRLGWGIGQGNDGSIGPTFGSTANFSFVPRSSALNTAINGTATVALDVADVPAPAAAPLALAGLAALGLVARRRG